METFTFSDLKIRTKGSDTEPPKLVVFQPNDVQTLYLDSLAADYAGFDWRNGVYSLRGAREDVLKARQQGLSTLWLAVYFLDTVNNPLTQTIIIADNGERAEMLFKIVHRFWEHLPRDRRPRKKYSSKKELEFTDLDSVIYVGTAGQGTVGRGGTINNVLASEYAHWHDAKEVMSGLMESVPGGGNVTTETTANGLNQYYAQRQQEHLGGSPFHPRFFSWPQTREYALAPVGGVIVDLTEAEQAEKATYGISDAQIEWKRRKLASMKALGTADKFDQEYPISESVAFLTSGNPYFDVETLRKRAEELESGAHEPLAGLVFSPDYYPELRNAYAQGYLQMWRMPDDDSDYIVCADPAGGINTDGKRDACSASVLCVQTWEQVVHLHGLWESRPFATLLAELGYLYGEALLGVHRRNHGVSVLDNLLNTERYPAQRGRGGSGVYFYDPSQVFNNAKTPDASTLQPGWDENTRTKPYMLDTLAEALVAAPGLIINSKASLAELRTFVHLPGGQAGGESGCHDDCVSDLALGAVLLNLRFERKRKRRERMGERQRQEPVTAWGEVGRQRE